MKKKQQKAFNYYLMGLKIREIAKLMAIPIRTVEGWSYRNKWKEKRLDKNLK